MSFLLDTNIISEWVKPQPNPDIMDWMAEVDEDRVFLTVASLAEIRHGIELLAPGQRRDRLERWLEDDLPARFDGRILDIDRRVATSWGVMMSLARRAGRPPGVMDAFFAATAEVHGLTLVTCNTRDFEAFGIELFDPSRRASS